MPRRTRFLPALAAALLLAPAGFGAFDNELIPPQLPQGQREKLQNFLKEHEKPKDFLPPDARVIGSPPGGRDIGGKDKPARPVKQFLVQITPHRPVPGQEEVRRADVTYFRPNPEKGKPGIAVRYTVDLATGKQVGQTEVLLNGNTPLAREELADAVALAREKFAAVQTLYKEHDRNTIRWEYLQFTVRRKHEPHEPGDRVVSLVFTAPGRDGQAPPAPVRVVVNLTKGVVLPGGK
ncbi:MAG TPA: hypothetical protein VFA26_16365 [Gemmataceae bacterium]|nr:hypothetical protein [Gemmataceae bacterium]